MKRRLFSILTFFALAFSLLPTAALAETGEIGYLDSEGDSQTYTGEYTPVTSVSTEWSSGWYVVSNSVTVADRIIVSGEVHLVLVDGRTMTASKGIQVSGDSNSLTIYGQSGGTGKLIAKGPDYSAGIGGTGINGETAATAPGGNITINGGSIESTGGNCAAGIGGGRKGGGSNIVINSGTVTANGGRQGAGIGGGPGGIGENITINGGTVTATGGGGNNSAGIGGCSNIGRNITIAGGTVVAKGGEKGGAGIGGGGSSTAGTTTQILISGGNVTATGGQNSAGIGGGANESVDGITITGGTVTATGGQDGPGIGSGTGENAVANNIRISGGSVTAQGTDSRYDKRTGAGAGIGAGKYGSVDGIFITGGTVIAKGAISQKYSGSKTTGYSWKDYGACGAGIGLSGSTWIRSDTSDTEGTRVKNIVISGSAKVYVQGGYSSIDGYSGADIGYCGLATGQDGNKEFTPDTTALLTTGFVKYYNPGDNMSNAEPLENSIYGVVLPAPSAAVSNAAISGAVGAAIASTDVTVTLTNDTFKSEITADTDVGSWFNLPAGLTARVKSTVSAGATEANITISGTPTAVSSAAMTITIPTASLTSAANLTVTSNANAKFAIGKGTLTANCFDFTAPANLICDGTDKTATVTLKSDYSGAAGTVTVKYEKGGSPVTETKDAGTYTVKIDVAAGTNYKAAENLMSDAWTFIITPADQDVPDGLGVTVPTVSGGKGKITGTTAAMEYSTDKDFASPAGQDCSDMETEVDPGTYYVRFKADSNHNASAAATVTVPAKYTVTVESDGNGVVDVASDITAGETVTLKATPNKGYEFEKWDDKTPSSLSIDPDGKFTMPSENVSVKARFKPAALTGTASITGTVKFGQELTASLTESNNTGTLSYKWYRDSTEISGATSSTYTLLGDDIGRTITVKVSSSVQTGEISSTATSAVAKADVLSAPEVFTLNFTLNGDGQTFTATIPAVTGGEYSFDGMTYSASNTKTDCIANTRYTGYVRIAETSTHNASNAVSSSQTSPMLTVAAPTFSPDGTGSFSGTQSVTISCATVGAKIYYTTDGTTPTAADTEYTVPLSLTATTTVKAIAVKPDMNDSAVSTAIFTKYSGGNYTPNYAISVDETEHGSVSASAKNAFSDTIVTITTAPDKGWTLETLTVTDRNGKAIDFAVVEIGEKYTFKMPSGSVTILATFMEDNSMLNYFIDVNVRDYFCDAVLWAAENGITKGTDDLHFSPDDPCTRGQIVTLLWRTVGSPEPKSLSSFEDVAADSYYAKAVAWAVENGITEGTGNGKFSPDVTCTRAQAVTFLARALNAKAESRAAFSDVPETAYYADAVAWAAESGVTTGVGAGRFAPANFCTRGQIVTFLYRAYVK